MDTGINDKVELFGDILTPFWLLPSIVLIITGPFVGLAMVIWSFSEKNKSLQIDYFGLLVSVGFLFSYILMPIGLNLDSSTEALDVRRHGYFSVADIYTKFLVYFVVFSVAIWTCVRVYKLRKINFGASLILYAIVNLAAYFVGWLVAGENGGAWTS